MSTINVFCWLSVNCFKGTGGAIKAGGAINWAGAVPLGGTPATKSCDAGGKATEGSITGGDNSGAVSNAGFSSAGTGFSRATNEGGAGAATVKSIVYIWPSRVLI